MGRGLGGEEVQKRLCEGEKGDFGRAHKNFLLQIANISRLDIQLQVTDDRKNIKNFQLSSAEKEYNM